MDRASFAYVAATLVAVSFATVLCYRWLGRWLARARARRRNVRAQRGEQKAELLLERHGYAIEERQATATWTIWVDGRECDIDLRADLLVSRRSARYVAEVKTGAVAPRITTAATRRQLLEYRLAYDVDGVLLVDAEDDRVTAVEFPLPRAGSRPRWWRSVLTWAALFLSGAASGAAALHLLDL
ncbi:MAG: hypothetical protein MJE77_26400 [Proteobacteria bacterium]|nr:hypothetical protein [Pseudomonadota bacterium]